MYTEFTSHILQKFERLHLPKLAIPLDTLKIIKKTQGLQNLAGIFIRKFVTENKPDNVTINIKCHNRVSSVVMCDFGRTAIEITKAV